MKKIAVLTDFSERSANASNYALMLARRLKANVLLYNAYLVPSADPISAQIALPMEDANEIKAVCENDLQKAAAVLDTKLDILTAGFRPNIEYQAQEGVFNASVETFLGDRDVVLLVMGNHHKGFSALLGGNHTRDVLDAAELPVLIVPETANFDQFRRIAFATDLNHEDLNVIQSLANVARPFNAEILLTHLCEQTPEQERKAQDFLHEVTNKVNYPNIYYSQFDEHNIHKGLSHMAAQVQADLMVMVHRKKNFLERLFGSSHSQQLAAESATPLLVFPYPTETLPAF